MLAQSGLICAEVLLRNCSVTHLPTS